MIGRSLALGCTTLLLTGTVGAAGRADPPAPPANICVTQWGWCDLPSITMAHGVACVCLTADDAQVPGITRHFPHSGSPSPYLRPHTTGPAPSDR